MRRLVGSVLTAVLATLAMGSSAGVAATGASVTRAVVAGTVGRPVTLDGAQVHTVLQVQRWYGGGLFVPKAGDAAVTVKVGIRALKETSYNPLWYALKARNGKSYGHVVVGARGPRLGASNHLRPGATTGGWLTFAIPLGQLAGLTLVYRMDAGFGPTLEVPLGRVPDSPRASLGRPASLEGEQVQTVSRVERPSSLGVWVAKPGDVFVTVYVTVRALKATTVGGRYYSLLAGNGTWYRGPTSASRKPTFPWKQGLSRGAMVRGWITMMVPRSLVGSLTLVYHLPADRTDLLVRLPG